MRLYSETFYGTKALIEGTSLLCRPVGAQSERRKGLTISLPRSFTPDYVKEVSEALKMVRQSKELTLEEKKRFYKSSNKARFLLFQLALQIYRN